MDFRDYAAKEASDLAARLTTAATAAAEDAARRVGDEARKTADGLREQLETALKEKSAAAALLEGAQAHARDAQTQAERLQGQLESATERVDAATRQLDDARKLAERLEAARVEVSAARDEQTAARHAAEAELRKTREGVESLRGELASAMETLDKAAAERMASEEAAAAANSQSQAAEVKLAAVTELLKKHAGRVQTLEQAQRGHEQAIQDLEARVQAARSASAASSASASLLEEMLAGFQALGAAGTINEVLTTLVEQLAAEFPRVALFRIKKSHLLGEHQIGFDLNTDIAKLVLPLGMDSLPSRAASSGRMERVSGDELKDSRTPFSGSPTAALALPIVVAGDTLAVIYADDSGASKAARVAGAADLHARFAEGLHQFAVAVLMRLTSELKALAELRQYAGSLLHEIEQMYEADVEAGRSSDELRKRLAGNLDYARSIYGSRTAIEGADAATLIDEELASLLELRGGTPFGHDLAAAAGRSETARTATSAS